MQGLSEWIPWMSMWTCLLLKKRERICALFKNVCVEQNVFLISHKRQIKGKTDIFVEK